jgi:dimethylamine/trimethylamine dehydrogenase
MVSQIKRGIMDFIGAARPSIADPFLPKKIEEGRIDEIRECIGCNMCVSSDYTSTNLRCTQNPTMGEEWRRGWHPEIIREKVRRFDPRRRSGSSRPRSRAFGGLGAVMRCILAEAGDELGGPRNP